MGIGGPLLRTVIAELLLVAACASAAPRIDKVEPPVWWTGHTWNPVQILLTGTDLRNATVSATTRGIRPTVRHTSADGRYAFVYLDIGKEARTGDHVFRMQSPSGSVTFTVRLEPTADLRSGERFQGFTTEDVIYLLIPDRFANGDTRNDHPAEADRPADRSQPRFYHGGDFAGIRARLGYLKDLGVTGIWLLPVYQNSRKGTTPGYFYGYEAADYYEVESRYGTLAELRALVDEAHRMGLKVMQDQAANHSGPAHPWLHAPPTPTWFHDLDRRPRLRNNFDIASLANPYARPKQRDTPVRGWFGGNLPDFNQDDPLVSDYLIQNALWWIGITGVDGVRQDTYPYVERSFWEKWQTALNRQFPGLFVVGEITAQTPAVLSFFEGGTRRAGVDTKLPSMLDFPLFHAIRNVFGNGEPFPRITDVLAQDSLYRHPEQLVAFFDNHDNARFLSLANADTSRLLAAQTFLLTTRRIPHLFYGDEIAMGADDNDRRRTTAADFPGGFPGDVRNAFLPEGREGDAGTTFDHLQALLRFRRQHPSLTRGRLLNLIVEDHRYIYLRSDGRDHVITVFRRDAKPDPLVLELDDTGLRDGLVFRHWHSSAVAGAVINGRVTLPAGKSSAELYWARD